MNMFGLRLNWRDVRADEVVKAPTPRSQFNSEQVDLPQALVREAVQNILDAAREKRTGPIRIRISIELPDVAAKAKFWELLQKLQPHLGACAIQGRPTDPEHLRLLLIEDFETTGLTGPWDNRGIGGWNDFFRQFGVSHKTGPRMGRWGLGKLVFTSASEIRTFFALTVREADVPAQALLMGQTVVRPHSINSVELDSHVFFSRPQKQGELQLPVIDQADIREFATAARLSRTVESGLSLVIPFPVEEIDPHQITRHLLANFFFPILSGDLVAEVCGADVSSVTFDNLIRHVGDESMKAGKLAGFVRQIRERQQTAPDLHLDASWTRKDGTPGADLPTSLKKRFANRELIYARFPVRLRNRTAGDQPSHVDVFVRRTHDDERPDSLCVRGMLTVPGEARRFHTDGCFIALVATEPSVVSFLGDAEGPAHTDWNSREDRLNENWVHAPARVSEIRQSARWLHQKLAAALDRVEEKALIDEFWIPDETPGEQHRTATRNGHADPQHRVQKFNVTRRNDGFTIAAGSGLADDDLPIRIRVRAAYDVVRGNPFAKHSPFDFDLAEKGEIDCRLDGCRMEAVRANALTLVATARSFRAQFTGFDANRDLVVNARSTS
ncbi:MAG: hypothetical protein ACRD4O_03250 [Bryobacteraceae bacterium]